MTYAIDDIVSLALRGRLRVPRFQRSFVWDGEDVRKLFDSIWRGFPVGTLLLWQHEAPAEPIQFGPLELQAPQVSDALWVVDGQQRVTSLVGALAPDAANVDPRFELCFDLRQAKFVHAGKRPFPLWWLPLRVTLESRTLLTWAREEGAGLGSEELDLADALSGALRDYRLSASVVEHDDDELLREVFDRVNSAGKKISRAQIFHALFGGTSEAASAGGVVESLRHEGFGDFDHQHVVQSLLAIRGGDVLRDLHNEFLRNEDPPREWWFDSTTEALSRTISFLRRQGVPHLLLVPSILPIPVLAAFFHLHPSPEPWIERLLARWLWRRWVHGYGQSGQTPALRQAVRAVHPKKGSPTTAPSEYEAVKALLAAAPDDDPAPVDIAGFRTDAAAGRLALLALAHLQPRDVSGGPVDIAAALERHRVDAVSELVPGHRTNLAARGFWPVGAPGPTGDEPPEVLASHAIEAGAIEALRRNDTIAFLRARGATIERVVGEFLAARLERGAPIRPPLDQLFVPDDDLEPTG